MKEAPKKTGAGAAARLYYSLPPEVMERVSGFLSLSQRRRLAQARNLKVGSEEYGYAAKSLRAVQKKRGSEKGHQLGGYYFLVHLLFFFAILIIHGGGGQGGELVLAPAIYGLGGFFFLQRRSLTYWRYRFSPLPLEVYEPIFFVLCYGAMVLTIGQLNVTMASEAPGPLLFLLAAFLAPLFEELFFRDVLFETLGGKTPALLLTALGFTLVHITLEPRLLDMVIYFNAGILLGAMRWLSGRIIFPFVIHSAVNITMMWV